MNVACMPPGAPPPDPNAAAGPGGGGGGGGRGGGQPPMVDPGRYTAILLKVTGNDQGAPIGKPQPFDVKPLPAKNW